MNNTSQSEIEIRFSKVSKDFAKPGGSETFTAVDSVDLEVRKGEILAILGKTGCGKSTIFNMIAGLQQPTRGRVEVQGHDPFSEFDALRGRIAIVFQSDRLLPWRTALDNAALGLEMMDVPQAERREEAKRWLARLGLAGHEADYPHALSGGMRQRVSIARAFATQASILLCDEPFSALDEITAQRLRGEFADLVRESGRTAVLITHSIAEALTIGTRIVVMHRPARIAYEAVLGPSSSEPERDGIRAAIQRTLAA